MATWTNIANTSLEPGSPARSVDAFALRDNPIAIAEGAAGAPRIAGQSGPAVQTAGLFDGAVTTAKIASNEQMTTANVLARTADAGAGAVGTYAFLFRTINSTVDAGTTTAGSSLRYSGVSLTNAGFQTDSTARTGGVGNTVAGTWRCMGRSRQFFQFDDNYQGTTLWLRIS